MSDTQLPKLDALQAVTLNPICRPKIALACVHTGEESGVRVALLPISDRANLSTWELKLTRLPYPASALIYVDEWRVLDGWTGHSYEVTCLYRLKVTASADKTLLSQTDNKLRPSTE